MILLVHVDDMIVGGEEKEVARVTDHLMKRYKVSVEDDQALSFLKRTLMVNEKYIHNLVKMMRPDIQFHVKELAGRLQSPTEGHGRLLRSWSAIWQRPWTCAW